MISRCLDGMTVITQIFQHLPSGSKYLERLGGRDGTRPGEELYLHCPRRVAGMGFPVGLGAGGRKAGGLKQLKTWEFDEENWV